MKYWDEATIGKIRKGFYSAVYFNRTKQILLQEDNLQSVTMQIFQKNDGVMLCGINQVVELLKVGTGYFNEGKWISKWDELEVKAVPEGETTAALTPIIHITGPYAYFAHLESLYLGILARMTSVATRTHEVIQVANEKSVLFFADRFDYFLSQELDGYAAKIGGAQAVATEAQSFLWNGKPVGTIPHSLIATYQGDAIQAAHMFAKHFPDVPLGVLIDFDNDCVTTALKVAHALGKKLWGVRLDTSESLIDKSLQEEKDNKTLHGVNPTLVKKVREALDKNNFDYVKIIVSGGFNKEKVARFEKENTPVDIYGIGSWFLQGTNPFTADIVKVGNKETAKVGRRFTDNPRMRICS